MRIFSLVNAPKIGVELRQLAVGVNNGAFCGASIKFVYLLQKTWWRFGTMLDLSGSLISVKILKRQAWRTRAHRDPSQHLQSRIQINEIEDSQAGHRRS
jgi:hypothetical protein